MRTTSDEQYGLLTKRVPENARLFRPDPLKHPPQPVNSGHSRPVNHRSRLLDTFRRRCAPSAREGETGSRR
jgi:hypothetical protein